MKARGTRPGQRDGSRTRTALIPRVLLVAALLVAGGLLAWWLSGQTPPGPMPWARLGTRDAHSLAFAPGSTDHLYFGHHQGILESTDGGRTWAPLPVEADAMGMQPATDGSIVVAGHEVLIASRDSGATWSPIAADLPNIDIHGFARDPSDGLRMWAYLATGGVYETRDGGTHWEEVLPGHRPFLVAVNDGQRTGLLAIDPFSGLVRSDDGGRTWQLLSQPEAFPVTAISATLEGGIVLLGTTRALLRSDDAGRSWQRIELPSAPLAIAVGPDGATIALVTQTTEFYRSDDRGRSWPGP